MLKWKPARKEGGVISHFYSQAKVEKKEKLKRAVVLPSCVQDVKGLSELLS